MRLIGTAIGYTLAAQLLQVYVVPELTPTITPDDPRWLGAWWIGWLVLSVPLMLAAFLACKFGIIQMWFQKNYSCEPLALCSPLPQIVTPRSRSSCRAAGARSPKDSRPRKANTGRRAPKAINGRYDGHIQAACSESRLHTHHLVVPVLLVRLFALLDVWRQVHGDPVSADGVPVEHGAGFVWSDLLGARRPRGGPSDHTVSA